MNRSPDVIGAAAEILVRHSLGKPDALYCPVSLQDDPYASPPIERVATPSGDVVVENWRTGDISYIYLSGLTFTFPDAQGQTTFRPEIESPDLPKATRAVLAGDRAFQTDLRNIAGSNHKKEGGWFYYVGGETVWKDRSTLAPHPTAHRSWLWPRTSRRVPAEQTAP